MYRQRETYVTHTTTMSTTTTDSLTTSLGHVVPTFLPGVAQGATTVMLGHPLDTAKTRLQAVGPHIHSGSVVQSVMEIARCEGVRGLYRGAAPPILMEGAKRGLQFGLWDIFKGYGDPARKSSSALATVPGTTTTTRSISSSTNPKASTTSKRDEIPSFTTLAVEHKEEPPALLHTACSSVKHSAEQLLGVVGRSATLSGALAGGIGTFIGCPMHVIKIQTQNQTSHGTLNAWTCTQDIWKREGFRGFYRGLKANMLKDVFFAGTYLGLYTNIRERLLAQRQSRHQDTSTVHFSHGEGNTRSPPLPSPTRRCDTVSLHQAPAAEDEEGWSAAYPPNPMDPSLISLSCSPETGLSVEEEPSSTILVSTTSPVDGVTKVSSCSSSSLSFPLFTKSHHDPIASALPSAIPGGMLVKQQQQHGFSFSSEPVLTFLAASTACMCTWVLLYPLDTMKTLIQSRRLSSITAVRSAHLSVREVYRGLSASLWRAGPIAGVAMLAYEELKQVCNTH